LATAFLIAIGAAVCLAVQLLVRRYWLGFFLSIVATMIAWIVTPLVFALVTTHPLSLPANGASLKQSWAHC
jgi:hypothetical protein